MDRHTHRARMRWFTLGMLVMICPRPNRKSSMCCRDRGMCVWVGSVRDVQQGLCDKRKKWITMTADSHRTNRDTSTRGGPGRGEDSMGSEFDEEMRSGAAWRTPTGGDVCVVWYGVMCRCGVLCHGMVWTTIPCIHYNNSLIWINVFLLFWF